MLHDASEKHGELKMTTWTVSLFHSVFMNLQGLTLLILEEWWGYLTAKLIVLDSSDMLRRKKMKCIDYTLHCKLIDRTMISTTTKTATKTNKKQTKWRQTYQFHWVVVLACFPQGPVLWVSSVHPLHVEVSIIDQKIK